MPTRLVEHEHGVGVRSDLGRQLGQKPAHGGGRDGGQHEGHFGADGGLHGGKEVSGRKALGPHKPDGRWPLVHLR